MAARGGHWSTTKGGGRRFVSASGEAAKAVDAVRDRYKVRAISEMRNDYYLADTKVRDSAGIPREAARGTESQVRAALRTRERAAATRARNAYNQDAEMIQGMVTQGLYAGIPLSQLTGRERRLEAERRRAL